MLWLKTADKRRLINLERVKEIYIRSNKTEVWVGFEAEWGERIKIYDDIESAKKALELLTYRIKAAKLVVIEMPTQEEVNKLMVRTREENNA